MEFNDIVIIYNYDGIHFSNSNDKKLLDAVINQQNLNNESNKQYFFTKLSLKIPNSKNSYFNAIIGNDLTSNKINSLSDIQNREELINYIKIYNSQKKIISLTLIDINNFKHINHTFGESFGDVILLLLSNLIKDKFQAPIIYRLHKDLFAIVQHFDTYEEAENNISLSNESLKKSLSYSNNLLDKPISISTGVKIKELKKLSTKDIYETEMALNLSKSESNNIVFYNIALKDLIKEKIKLEQLVFDNIKNDNTLMYLQPQFNNKYQIVGAEALVRMYHIDNFIYPGDFISIAEKFNLIHKIDLSILNKACKQLQEWKNKDILSSIAISCNMSMKTIEYDDFVSSVKNAIDIYSINPKLLKLEITETILVNNIELVLQKLLEIQKLGVSISLDDFGTGNSSLTYLKDFPINQLKIDKSFVDHIHLDSKYLSIIKFIVELAKDLSLELVVEGVENQSQIETLNNIGCNTFQGYYFSKPITVEDFEFLCLTKKI